jgi:hypothetical protein
MTYKLNSIEDEETLKEKGFKRAEIKYNGDSSSESCIYFFAIVEEDKTSVRAVYKKGIGDKFFKLHHSQELSEIEKMIENAG